MAALVSLFSLLLLQGCATGRYTVDDGRPVDEELLAGIRAYGVLERAVRPAIVRSAALAGEGCDRQWELPFSLASSEAWSDDDRVAWARGLGVDERVGVVAAAPGSPLQPGDRLVAVDGAAKLTTADELIVHVAAKRDRGRPFGVQTAAGQRVIVQPFQVCRGYTRFAPPNAARLQDYHWLMSLHPLQVADAQPTPDEALWLVLWTQGLSEEGGARMKAYHVAVDVAGALYQVVTIATGVRGAALAAESAVKAAQQAAAQLATEILKQELIDQAQSYAVERMRQAFSDAFDQVSRSQVIASMQKAAANRGVLGGMSRVAGTVFDRADAWALPRMERLGADPLAGVVLHQKLAEADRAQNAFVFDIERLTALGRLAESRGLGERLVAILRGLRPQDLDPGPAMPLMSARRFAYESAPEPGDQPFGRGLIDASLSMPVDSRRGR
ncbi:hypothetical protein [Piscinibacter sakaiensis]|uniref:PDZ domain-containing protein n=1 Tax=Piscinibacter sakaiensis TaxID=1547922 RepID=A0A0K8NZC1_PISS1|nr:hypothetical protein [Piscinibacter sakaiensis]GAP35747.1 hypothetical protein ISF6_1520 [Piscinibacter sakaiensis]